jgi:hypothetical protein
LPLAQENDLPGVIEIVGQRSEEHLASLRFCAGEGFIQIELLI